jgi:hypothetical protein
MQTPEESTVSIRVVEVYTDGGTCGAHGVFAYCFVNSAGERIRRVSGTIGGAKLGFKRMCSTAAEIVAAWMAFRGLPDGWAGCWYADSNKALRHVMGLCEPPDYIPEWVWRELHVEKARLGGFKAARVAAHPTALDMLHGMTLSGLPVSQHNIWCEAECSRQRRLVASRRRAKVRGAAVE